MGQKTYQIVLTYYMISIVLIVRASLPRNAVVNVHHRSRLLVTNNYYFTVPDTLGGAIHSCTMGNVEND